MTSAAVEGSAPEDGATEGQGPTPPTPPTPADRNEPDRPWSLTVLRVVTWLFVVELAWDVATSSRSFEQQLYEAGGLGWALLPSFVALFLLDVAALVGLYHGGRWVVPVLRTSYVGGWLLAVVTTLLAHGHADHFRSQGGHEAIAPALSAMQSPVSVGFVLLVASGLTGGLFVLAGRCREWLRWRGEQPSQALDRSSFHRIAALVSAPAGLAALVLSAKVLLSQSTHVDAPLRSSTLFALVLASLAILLHFAARVRDGSEGDIDSPSRDWNLLSATGARMGLLALACLAVGVLRVVLALTES